MSTLSVGNIKLEIVLVPVVVERTQVAHVTLLLEVMFTLEKTLAVKIQCWFIYMGVQKENGSCSYHGVVWNEWTKNKILSPKEPSSNLYIKQLRAVLNHIIKNKKQHSWLTATKIPSRTTSTAPKWSELKNKAWYKRQTLTRNNRLLHLATLLQSMNEIAKAFLKPTQADLDEAKIFEEGFTTAAQECLTRVAMLANDLRDVCIHDLEKDLKTLMNENKKLMTHNRRIMSMQQKEIESQKQAMNNQQQANEDQKQAINELREIIAKLSSILPSHVNTTKQ